MPLFLNEISTNPGTATKGLFVELCRNTAQMRRRYTSPNVKRGLDGLYKHFGTMIMTCPVHDDIIEALQIYNIYATSYQALKLGYKPIIAGDLAETAANRNDFLLMLEKMKRHRNGLTTDDLATLPVLWDVLASRVRLEESDMNAWTTLYNGILTRWEYPSKVLA